jgi:recombination associated protein RdgC
VKLIPDLIEALGGEAESGVASAAQVLQAPPAGSDAGLAAATPVPPKGRGVSERAITGPAAAPLDTDPETAPF